MPDKETHTHRKTKKDIHFADEEADLETYRYIKNWF
jgi:hypothetical protein